MNGFIFRVSAHHGEPVIMNGCGVRNVTGIGVENPVMGDQVTNDPDNPVITDLSNKGQECDYDIGALIADFEDEYGCKVNYDYDINPRQGDIRVFEFDVFEPSWPSEDEAKDVVDDLSERLTDWAEGYPRGR